MLPAILTQRHSLDDTIAPMDGMLTPEGEPCASAWRMDPCAASDRRTPPRTICLPSTVLRRRSLRTWHSATGMGAQINECTWYSGTPEPDGFAKGGDGGSSVLLVDLDENILAKHVPVVKPMATGRFLRREKAAALHEAADIAALEASVRTLDADLSCVLLRLTVSGALDLPARERFEATIRLGLSSAQRTLILNDAYLLVKPTAADLESIDHMGFVRTAGDRLAVLAADEHHADHEFAAAALQRLYLLHVQQGAQAR